MKQEQGTVMAVFDGVARIRVGRHAECVSCGACASSRHVMVEAINELGALPGQRVVFAMQEQQVLTGAFVVFVLPLLAAGAGVLTGWQVALWLAADVGAAGSYGAIAGGVCFFLLSLVFVKFFDRRAARSQEAKPVITKILGD